MGGVGRNTEIHHIQVSYSQDDSYEWFGGNCDSDYLAVMGGLDDMFDTDFGHQGRHQFCFTLRDPDYSDAEGQSNGFESDNYKESGVTDDRRPLTKPVFANCTVVGPEYNDSVTLPLGHAFEYAACVRRCSQNSVHNSVIMGFPWGLTIRDACSQTDATMDSLNFHYTSIQASGLAPASTSVHDEGRWAGVTAWFDAEPGNNALHSQPRNPSTVGLTDMSDLNDPDARPLPTSELITTPANWTHWQVSSYFQPVTYRGAFPASSKGMSGVWTDNWTNWDPQYTDYDPATADVEGPEVSATRMLAQNHPNPFNPVTTIAYSVKQAGAVTIEVYDVSGKVVRTLLDNTVDAGASGSVVWDGTNDRGEQCASGVYFYGIKTADETETRKMVMLK